MQQMPAGLRYAEHYFSSNQCLCVQPVHTMFGLSVMDLQSCDLSLQVLGNAGHQCSCDVWSAGIILYILLAGYPPFNGASERSILNRIKKGQYTFAGTQWDSVSAEAKQAIKKMLVLKPSKRATAAQMVHSSWFKDARSVSNRVCVAVSFASHILHFFSRALHHSPCK